MSDIKYLDKKSRAEFLDRICTLKMYVERLDRIPEEAFLCWDLAFTESYGYLVAEEEREFTPERQVNAVLSEYFAGMRFVG